jgi:hypothetical protein
MVEDVAVEVHPVDSVAGKENVRTCDRFQVGDRNVHQEPPADTEVCLAPPVALDAEGGLRV